MRMRRGLDSPSADRDGSIPRPGRRRWWPPTGPVGDTVLSCLPLFFGLVLLSVYGLYSLLDLTIRISSDVDEYRRSCPSDLPPTLHIR